MKNSIPLRLHKYVYFRFSNMSCSLVAVIQTYSLFPIISTPLIIIKGIDCLLRLRGTDKKESLENLKRVLTYNRKG